MKVSDFWKPTAAAEKRISELRIITERRPAPNADMHYGCELPDEFLVIWRGNPAAAAVVGVSSEPTAAAMRAASRIARKRIASRPGIGSPDGQFSHDHGVAVAALMECGFSRPEYRGETLPWFRHESYAAARAAAFRAAISPE